MPKPAVTPSPVRACALSRGHLCHTRPSSWSIGRKCGGGDRPALVHTAGDVTTLALVPCVVDAVAPIPAVAAGGIADARGLVAALALGAQAVMIGTRLIATPEADAHPVYKQKVLAATEDQTVRTMLFGYGWPNAPHRTLRTPFVARWLPEEARGGEQRPDEPRIGETKIGEQPMPLLRLMGFPPTPDASGDLESMAFLAGQSVGLVQGIKPAARDREQGRAGGGPR